MPHTSHRTKIVVALATVMPELSPADFDKLLTEWVTTQKEAKRLQAKEFLLRQRIFQHCFPSPVEGSTNKFELPLGYKLKGDYRIYRTVDIASLEGMKKELESDGIKVDELIEYKPDLVMKPYRALTAEQRLVFDQVLTIKPGAPGLELVPPAAPKA
jgi:hypothetical protein